ncbi:hypothetical protein LTS18_006333 [Coniosporium uncinatum]|uniref:Uncharacterized protein n=1 Tax=Coniosporium uncinatum TaxID=93489 RepID=A0ACC3DXC1_9PEZI|nr:hypothetical protein LTS18_006333 [Coniosporium uncinatum]
MASTNASASSTNSSTDSKSPSQNPSNPSPTQHPPPSSSSSSGGAKPTGVRKLLPARACTVVPKRHDYFKPGVYYGKRHNVEPERLWDWEVEDGELRAVYLGTDPGLREKHRKKRDQGQNHGQETQQESEGQEGQQGQEMKGAKDSASPAPVPAARTDSVGGSVGIGVVKRRKTVLCVECGVEVRDIKEGLLRKAKCATCEGKSAERVKEGRRKVRGEGLERHL